MLELPQREVHVWCAPLDVPAPVLRRLQATLAPDERHRADRFHALRNRHRYIAARGQLRDILGRYVGVPPSQLCFSYGPFGKPALAAAAREGIQFNLSHAGGTALYAVAAGRSLGVDLEQIRPMPDLDALAARFFSRQEYDALRALAPGERLAAFFTCWTRKEAYVKARGEGLSFPLEAFDVSISPHAPPALLHVRGDPQEVRRWSFADLAPGAAFKAALAVEGAGWQLVYRPWLQAEGPAQATCNLRCSALTGKALHPLHPTHL